MVGDIFVYVGKGFKICPCTTAVEFLYLYCNYHKCKRSLRCQVTWATTFCMVLCRILVGPQNGICVTSPVRHLVF